MQYLSKNKSIATLLVYFLGYTLIAPFVMTFAAIFICMFKYPTLSQDFDAMMASPELMSIFNASEWILNVVFIVIFILICFKYLKNDVIKFFGNLKYNLIISLKCFGFMYVTQIVLSLAINLIFDLSSSVNQELVESAFMLSPLKITFLTVIFAPIVEELVFRSAIFSLCRNNKKLQIILASCLFGFIHVFGSVLMGNYLDVVNVIVYIGLGYWLSYAYIKTDTIATPIFVHFLNNLLGVVLMFLTL